MTKTEQIARLTVQLSAERRMAENLRAEIGKLQAALTVMRQRAIDGAVHGYTEGRESGYQAGAFDALCPVSPDHDKAVNAAARGAPDKYMSAIAAGIKQAHADYCATLPGRKQSR